MNPLKWLGFGRSKNIDTTSLDSKASNWSDVLADVCLAGNEIPKPKWGNTAKLSLMTVNPTISACLREISTSLVEPSLQVGTERDGEFTPDPSNPLQAVLDRPHRLLSMKTWLKLVVERYYLTGAGYAIRYDDDSFLPVPTDKVERIAVGSDLLSGYRILPKRTPVLPEDMFVLQELDPRYYYKPMSPVDCVVADVMLDAEIQTLLLEVTRNLDIPGTVIALNKPTSSKKNQRVRTKISDGYGKGNRGRTLVLGDSGADVKIKTQNPLKDFAMTEALDMIEARITSALGVPGVLIGGHYGNKMSTYSNYAEARASFYMETMLPLWRKVESELTDFMATDNYVIRFNLDDVEALQPDIEGGVV